MQINRNFKQGAGVSDRPKLKPVPSFTSKQIRFMARTALRGKWKQAAAPAALYMIFSMLPALLYYFLYYMSIIGTGVTISYTDLMSAAPGGASADNGFISAGNMLTFYQLAVSGAFSVGISALSLKILRGETFSAGTVFTGFRNFIQSFCTGIFVSILTTLWTALFIMPGSLMLVISIGISGISGGTSAMIFLSSAVLFAGTLLAVMFTMRYSMSYFIAADDRSIRASYAVTYSVFITRGRITSLFSLILSFAGWFLLTLIPLYISIMIIAAAGTGFIACAASLALFAVFCISNALLMLYVTTAKAVLYSTITGNFRTGAGEETVS